MEIPQRNNHNNQSIELNNKLLKLYKSYVLYSQDVVIRDEKKFIGSVYGVHDDKESVVLRVDYIVLGSYSKEKNVWIWADQSQSINKNTKILVSNLRSSIVESDDNSNMWFITRSGNQNDDDQITKRIKVFCSLDYAVISTAELCTYLNYLSLIISEKIKGSVFLTTERGNNIDVLIVKKILFNNIKY